MIQRYLLSAALVAAFAMPAAAATMSKAKSYYAEQSLKTKYCYVVDFKPNPKIATMIGTGSYPTMAKATAAITATKGCKAPPMKMKPKSK